MAARKLKVFTTDQLTKLLGLDPKKDKWRVVKFAESHEYNIEPSVSAPAGPGSRRLYDIENACEFALALRLLETGLRSRVIGRVIRELRKKGKLCAKLEMAESEVRILNLAIIRIPEPGKPLDETRRQVVGFCQGNPKLNELVGGLFRDPNIEFDLILVPVGSTFSKLKQHLDQLQMDLGKAD